MPKKLTILAVIFCLLLTFSMPFSWAKANGMPLPVAGSMINLSPAYDPVIIKGLTVHKDNPFLFDFIVDVGQDKASGEFLKREGERLIKYFLASLALPDEDTWVNLSPYEKERVIPEALGQTDMGRDLLAQDYILKQITASLIYPEKELGRLFWDKVYAKAHAMYGTNDIPVNTFNKVWIIADQAEVFEHNQTAFVVKQHLKVMLEEDYLALSKHKDHLQVSRKKPVHNLASQIIKTIILPELEKEVNTGQNFANLRQIFNSVILASWYKKNLKQALLNELYTDKGNVKGIMAPQARESREVIYEQYLKAYKKGVFNYIKEDINQVNGQREPRKYFSGGITRLAVNPTITDDNAQLAAALPDRAMVTFETMVKPDELVADIEGKPVVRRGVVPSSSGKGNFDFLGMVKKALVGIVKDVNVDEIKTLPSAVNFINQLIVEITGKEGAADTIRKLEGLKQSIREEMARKRVTNYGSTINDAAMAATTLKWRLDMPQIAAIKGGKIMTNSPVDERVNQVPFPMNSNILILEVIPGDAKRFAGGMIHLLGLSEHNNTIRTVQMTDGWQKSLGDFKPDIILAPNDVYHEQKPVGPVRQQVQQLAQRLGIPISGLFYQSNEMPVPITHYVSFSDEVLERNIRSMAAHATQVARTDYETAINGFSRYMGSRYSKDPRRPHANVFSQETIYPNGKKVAGNNQQAVMLDISNKAPALVVAPHPDDETFEGGVIMEMLKQGRNVTVFVRGNGCCGVGDLSPEQHRWAIEYLQKNTKEAERFWQNLKRSNDVYTPYVEQWQQQGVSAEVINRKLLVRDVEGLKVKIAAWQPGDEVTPDLHEIATRIIRIKELQNERDIMQEKGTGKIDLVMLDLDSGLWPPSLGNAPAQMLKQDQMIMEENVKGFYRSNKALFDADYRDGKNMQIITPHRLDNHPHHQDTADMVAPTVVNLVQEIAQPVDVAYYLAPWAGDYELYVHYGDDVERAVYGREAHPEAQSNEAIGVLNGELSNTGGFGGASPTVQDMGGKYAERFAAQLFVPDDAAQKGVIATDSAMIEDSWTQGGIDLNTAKGMQWKVSKEGKGVEMTIDPAMLARIKREGIDSLSAVVIRITPVNNVWSIVGLQAPAALH